MSCLAEERHAEEEKGEAEYEACSGRCSMKREGRGGRSMELVLVNELGGKGISFG